jgi:glucose-6-phosphate 1-epimerase
MAMVKDLNDRFAIPNALHFELDEHGMERAVIKTPQAEATIYLQGAHITHYQPAGHKPVLFLSSKSHFAPGKAIRGGIPIIFPWFGAKKDDPIATMHGFARTSPWIMNSAQSIGDLMQLGLTLQSPEHSNLRLIITIGARLNLTLEVTNVSNAPLTFEEAFHTYLAVSDVRNVMVQGVDGTTFIDKTDQMLRKFDQDRMLQLQVETDRVYLNTQSTCRVFDMPDKRCTTILKHNSATTVVWNPWSDKSKTMADMGEHDWQRMLCIETANAADNAITLEPGATHRMTALISAEAFDPIRTLAGRQYPSDIYQRRAG